MLVDPFGRSITCLRISVTDRCNYRCRYCMPEEGVAWRPRQEMLRYEEIARIAAAAAALGVSRIRITGGEPLVRRGLERLVRLIAAIPAITDLGMTTNGSLLTPRTALMLRQAGLMRVNVSLDTLDPGRFARITRGGDVREVIAGIDAALAAGLSPVKINMVLDDETTDGETAAMRPFCAARGAVLQTIGRFSLSSRGEAGAVKAAADRPRPCASCDRLRLTADGHLKPCLFSDRELRIDINDIAASLREAVAARPRQGSSCSVRTMNQIGG